MTPKKQRKDRPRLAPHNIDQHTWWYEEPVGITVVVEPEFLVTRQVRLRWPALLAAAERCGKLTR